MPTILKITDFGAQPNTDAGPALRAAAAKAKQLGTPTIIQVPAGRYLLNCEPSSNHLNTLTMNGMKDVTLQGVPGKSELIFTDPRDWGILLQNCQNITVKDLIFDCDPLPFSQGVITKVNAKEGNMHLRLDEGYPDFNKPWYAEAKPPYQNWGMVMDPKTRNPKNSAGDYYPVVKYTHLGGQDWQLDTTPENRWVLDNVVAGDLYVMLARLGLSVLHAIDSSKVVFRNILIYSYSSLNVALVGAKDQTLIENLRVKIRPGTNRLLTTCSDGIHCQSNRVGPLIRNCHFEGMADDAINIYCPAYVVSEQPAPDQLRFKMGWSNMKQGDLVQVFSGIEGVVRGQGRVTKLDQQPGQLTITLDTPINGVVVGDTHQKADTLYNLSASGSGYKITGCSMKGHRRFAANLKGCNGIVENCIINDTNGTALVIHNDPGWPEGPIPNNLVIRNNKIIGTGKGRFYSNSPQSGAIEIGSIDSKYAPTVTPYATNILIEGNSFTDYPGCAISLQACAKVTIRKNTIRTALQKPTIRRAALIRLARCKQITISDNEMSDQRRDVTAAVELAATPARELTMKGNKLKLRKGTPERI